MKDMITSDKIFINPKFRKGRDVDNFLNFMICTNHDHAAQLGVKDRRFFVLEVDNAKAGDTAYWDALYSDLKNGGYSQFLNFLLTIDLERWHPRMMRTTEVAKEQSRMSGDSFIQWMRASLEVGRIVGERRSYGRM